MPGVNPADQATDSQRGCANIGHLELARRNPRLQNARDILVEALERNQAELVAACRERVSAGISLLDPDGPEDGRRVSRWGLRVNVRVESEEPS